MKPRLAKKQRRKKKKLAQMHSPWQQLQPPTKEFPLSAPVETRFEQVELLPTKEEKLWNVSLKKESVTTRLMATIKSFFKGKKKE